MKKQKAQRASTAQRRMVEIKLMESAERMIAYIGPRFQIMMSAAFIQGKPAAKRLKMRLVTDVQVMLLNIITDVVMMDEMTGK